MKYKTLSIIIPVFNENKFIKKTIDVVVSSKTNKLKKEMIIIDDASTDGTTKTLKDIEKKYLLKPKNRSVKIKFIYKKKNQGKGAALKAGFIASVGDIVLVQDADLEYSPDDYPLLLEPFIRHNADVVYGSRFISDRPHRVLYFWHYLANLFLTTLSNVFTNLNLTDMETGYKVFKGDIIRKLAPKLKSKRFGFEPEITARIAKIKSIKIYEVGVSYWGRTYDEGKKIGWKDGVRAIVEIIKFNLLSK